MRLIRHLNDLPEQLRGGAVAIGNFDGVHRGHARIVERLLTQARRLGGPAIVFTFDPHPVRLLRPDETPPPLTWTERKAELLVELGVDSMIAYPTDQALLQMSPEEFFARIVRDRLDAKAMVEGPNFRFGHDRSGTIDVLRRLCDESHMTLEVVEPLIDAGQPVSSSRIRKLIAEGRIDETRRMLTEPYRIRGMVTHGDGRGASIGFPTANLEGIDTLLPGHGVYAGIGRHVAASDTLAQWSAAINVGPSPTFGQRRTRVEAHLIGCDESLYGEVLEIDFRHRLRDIAVFDSVEALKTQLQQDINETKRRTTDKD